MVDSLEDLDRLAGDIKTQLTSPETLERLFEEVAPRLVDGGRNLVYVLAQVERIGHLTMEQFFLKTLHSGMYDRIILVTGSLDQPGVNPAVLDVPGPEFVHVETTEPMLPFLGFLDGGLMRTPILDLLLVTPQRLTRDFGRAVIQGAPLRHFVLPEATRARGDRWMRSIGAEPGEPFALLHVRDANYRPDKAHHLFRCADIRRYKSAIDRLVRSGYWVFRLGDASSFPLEHPSSRVVDVVRHSDYDPFLDVYLAACCTFAVNQASGPEALARAFGRPALTVNLNLEHLRLPLPSDRLVFKHFRFVAEGTELSYAEMLEAGIATFGSSKDFEEAGILVEENTEEELDAAVAEMIAAGSACGPADAEEKLQVRFQSIGRAYEERVRKDPEIIAKHEDFFAYAHPFGRLSTSFAKLNPGFLKLP